jgi:hypothetical protein
LSSFTGADLANFRGVRFTFNQTALSQISLGNVRLTTTAAGPGGLAVATQTLETVAGTMPEATRVSETNQIVAIRRAVTRTASGASRPAVEIEVYSSRAFPIGGALPELAIGGQRFTLSRFSSGKSDRLIFTLDAADFAALRNGADMSVTIGGAPRWDLGLLRKQ